MGFYTNGKFNLSVSLRYAPATQELNFLCQMFQQVSRVLYDATDGQQYIASVHFAPDGLGGEGADIWIHPNADVWPNSTSARLWFTGESLDVSQDFTYYATILAHELSHYLYDLRDEYNNGSTCQGNITTQASLMEGYSWDFNNRWTDAAGNNYANFAAFFADFVAGTAVLQAGQLNEFCHAGNHNATANNNQNNINGNQSCWTYMGDNANHGNLPYNLSIPGAAGPTLAAPAPNPPATVCIELINAQRFMLVLDRSFSMVGSKIGQLIAGANFWVDYVNAAEELGIVRFSGTSTLAATMSEVPASAAAQATWRTDRHTIIAGTTAAGSTGIGDALRLGLTNILAAGSAAAQVIILFTDGLQNTGTETAQDVLPDAVAAGVKIYTIGLGADQDVALLTSIADVTGGMYFGIPADISDNDSSDAISDALAHVSGQSRSNSAVKSFAEIDGSTVDSSYVPSLDTVLFNWTESKKTRPRQKIDSFVFPVEITSGSTNCTLGVKWYDRALSYRIQVTDPTGIVIIPSATARLVSGKHPYTFYDITNPKPGKWTVEVFGNIRASQFRTIGFEVNRNVRFEVAAVKNHIKAGEVINLRAKLMYGFALPEVSMQANVRTPSGKIQTVKFYENKGTVGEKEEEKVYTATIKTDKAEQGQYSITVVASYKGKQFVFKPDELYSQKPGSKTDSVLIKTPAIYRQKTLSVQASRTGSCDCHEKEPMLPGYNSKEVWINLKQKELVKRWKAAHNKD
ncbi:VWA domain-containing protein [Spirosoma spitsbergense]|uniref:VWA domain-containing protein n=1 Tax=Spirosoma spitsbergense TaxID=431554 RepID=UPI000372F97D|nr:VWA domain-containing protein [Spirosoma spitsbergense]